MFFVSQFSSGILAFLLLPLYTRYLAKEQYGTADLIATSVNLLMPVFTLCISQATLRFAMIERADKRHIFSFGLKVITAGFFLLLAGYPLLNNIAGIEKYLHLFYMLYIASSIDTHLSYFARAINKVVLVGVSGVIKTIVMIGANLILLIVFNLGITGYVVSSVLSHVASIIILSLGGKLYSYYTIKKPDTAYEREMLIYSVPLVPNSLSWWLSNYASRYIILLFCGVGAQGMFAVASKVPAILTTVQIIFIHAWQLSAISEYDKPRRDEFYSRIYKLYNIGMVFCAAILILFVRVIARLLFAGEYYEAWVYVPMLLVAVVFGALSGFLGTFFAAGKRNEAMFTSTLIGGISAVTINIALVPSFGPVGASIAAVAANIIVWMIRLVKSRKYANLNAETVHSCLCYVLLILQASCMMYFKGWNGYIGAALVLVFLIAINITYIKYLLRFTVDIIKKTKKERLLWEENG